MDPNLSIPTSIWSASLKLGYVGCLKDLVINGADIDVVAYTHEQNSGKDALKKAHCCKMFRFNRLCFYRVHPFFMPHNAWKMP